MLQVNHLIGFGARHGNAGGPWTVSYAARGDVGAGATATFNAFGIGSAAANRKVIIAVGQNSGTRPATPTITVNTTNIGSPAIIRRTDYAGAASTTKGIWIYDLTSGTTADIVVTWSTTVDITEISTWAAYGTGSNTPYHTNNAGTGANPTGVDVNVPAGGIVVAGSMNGSTSTHTWTGPTEDFDASFRTFYATSGASLAYAAAATPTTVSVNQSAANVQAVVAASWGP